MNKVLKNFKHRLFILNLSIKRYILLMRGESVYHVIGDSHSLNFLNPKFIIHHIGPATAYRLASKESTNKSKKKINDIFNIIYKNKILDVIFVFGEIDARIHIYKAHKENNISLETSIKKTIDSYINFMAQIKKKFPKAQIFVLGILPTGEEKNIYKFSFYPSKNIRKSIVLRMNELLETETRNHKFKFINIYNELIDSKGNRKEEYKFDKVHYNRKILNLILSKLD